MKIFILGISGMLGHKIFEEFCDNGNYDVRGSVRKFIPDKLKKYKDRIDTNVNGKNLKKINFILNSFRPDYVINCIGYIKQNIDSKTDLREVYFLNSFLPHRIFKICNAISAKFIHFSTDCVFDGKKGNYSDTDVSNADDVYGISKFLGEGSQKNFITIRTSIIGHELSSKNGLLEWFLNKYKSCEGYPNSFFSGVTTLEMFNFLKVLIKKNLNYKKVIHLSSKKISKYNLLVKINKTYNKDIKIKKNARFKIDRSLNCSCIPLLTKFYKVPSWDKMIKSMHSNYLKKKNEKLF